VKQTSYSQRSRSLSSTSKAVSSKGSDSTKSSNGKLKQQEADDEQKAFWLGVSNNEKAAALQNIIEFNNLLSPSNLTSGIM